MGNLFNVYRSLRNGVQFEKDLTAAIWHAAKVSNSAVSINPKKLTVTLREITVSTEKNSIYFFQKVSYREYVWTQDISKIDISKPFVVVEHEPRTDGSHYTYLCTV